jgi:hypothetical protein
LIRSKKKEGLSNRVLGETLCGTTVSESKKVLLLIGEFYPGAGVFGLLAGPLTVIVGTFVFLVSLGFKR